MPLLKVKLASEFLYDGLNILMCSYQDLQKGLDLGVVSPEVLQNFFDLEQYPFISELTHQFQVYFVLAITFVCDLKVVELKPIPSFILVSLQYVHVEPSLFTYLLGD